MTVQCCKCKRIRVGGCWLPESAALEAPASHSYCPECLFETSIEMFNERASVTILQDANSLLNDAAATAPR